jgi:hypothetical protein
MDKIPPSRITPPQIPVAPKQAGKPEERRVQQPPQRGSGKEAPMPLDSHAMSVRLAALATEAKEKELSMAKIVERAIEETGMTNPQAAMEEVNKHLQKEIDEILDTIKSNKELMEQAESWQALGDLLEHSMTKGQAEAFIQLVEAQIKAMK